LNSTDGTSANAGGSILYETDNELNKSLDDRDDIFILMEASESSGAFILENNNKSYGILEDDSGLIILNATAVGDSILLNATDGSSTDAGDEVLLDRTDVDGSDAGDKVLQQSKNEGDNILHEVDEGVGQDIILERGTSVGVGYKLILESQRIEVESEISEGVVPDVNWFDNSQFPSFVRPSEIFIRPHGHAKLQDTFDGFILLNGTDSSSTNAGNYLDWENGTYSSLIGN